MELTPHLPADPSLIRTVDLSRQDAERTAAMLTASAYGLSDWAFVAPTDCGLGLFARSPLQAGQFVVEYAGPRVPLECINKGEYVVEFPGKAAHLSPSPTQ